MHICIYTYIYILILAANAVIFFYHITEQKLNLNSKNHVDRLFIPANSIVNSYAGSWRTDDLANKNDF